jgi:hypothetical protein
LDSWQDADPSSLQEGRDLLEKAAGQEEHAVNIRIDRDHAIDIA